MPQIYFPNTARFFEIGALFGVAAFPLYQKTSRRRKLKPGSLLVFTAQLIVTVAVSGPEFGCRAIECLPHFAGDLVVAAGHPHKLLQIRHTTRVERDRHVLGLTMVNIQSRAVRRNTDRPRA